MKCGHCDERAPKKKHWRLCKALPHCTHSKHVHVVCDACWEIAFGDVPPEPEAVANGSKTKETS